MSYKRAILARGLGTFVLNCVIVFFALAPLLWGFSSSIKPTDQILKVPPEIIPSEVTFAHYRTLIENDVFRYMGNSAIVSAATVLLCLGIGTFAGYALSRFAFRGRNFVMVVVVTVMSIPIAALLVPTYTLIANIGLLDTRTGLVLLYTAYELPIVIWIMLGYFNTIPRQLEHAAMIDGYSRFETLRRVILPLTGPAMIASGLFVLTSAWNDFVVAVVMTSGQAVRTLPVAVYFYLGFFGREWGPLLAASMVSMAPIILIFILFQKYFVSGVTGGSVKG
ncbi:carbohydrate ABC transporter permease [Chelatococcus asaccharovorans]|uniref:Carbohydrate ABC transporter membrane protein 2 (CUT1 family) n=1 Tax=Chelatococcus asaccharovorans TaxID=28210 RepID=A0A2V3TV27_9HYPH|nr:carbohydrate ABC transporter permease [Chelatococcus asaccharovorans]MBS7706156.1 carbohydrate ABC transporter permease [Chelatococcus asaccharovorans]PXW52531.1 carbohydrate ABC transporter membrane protein 2 (CUT1 family) [Chelatococcus asaccharovorans]